MFSAGNQSYKGEYPVIRSAGELATDTVTVFVADYHYTMDPRGRDAATDGNAAMVGSLTVGVTGRVVRKTRSNITLVERGEREFGFSDVASQHGIVGERPVRTDH